MASTPYTVQSGDWLQKIAEQHGFESWRDLYDHEDNAAFRAKRPDPNKIYPGDIVMIPDRGAGTEPPSKTIPATPPTEPPPEDLETVIAAEGDTLCSIAVDHGFVNCDPLRAVNPELANRQVAPGDEVRIPARTEGHEEGATEQTHEFERPGEPFASIRFVHGSATLAYEDDVTITELNISNYVTNRAGNNGEGNAAFVGPDHRTFDANADEDVDTYKVEVRDLRTTQRELDVQIEALKPTYNAAGALTGHVAFDGTVADAATERGKRSLSIQAEKMGSTDRYRTSYLRLVVDDIDSQVAPHDPQTLLTSDLVDAAAGAANAADASAMRRVEILDQDVEAMYMIDGCPAPSADARCRVRTRVPIARGRTVDIAVRVLRTVPTGVVETQPGGPGDNGVVRLADIRRRIEMFCRRVWAQSHVKFRIVRLETVDLPSNMITVGDLNPNVSVGNNAAGSGPGQIGFRISVNRFGRAPNSVHNIGPFNVPAGNTPAATANLIRTRVNAIPGLQATVSVNPAEVFNTVHNPDGTTTDRQSADVLFTDTTANGRITITNLTALNNQDAAQGVAVNSLNMNIAIRNGNDDYHVGSTDERNLYKPLDTGDRVIDLYVVQGFTGRPNLLGFTVPECKEMNPNRRLMTTMMNTIVMRQDSSDGSNTQPYALPHEIGHVLLDNSRHADSRRQLMFPTLADAADVNDTKRLIGRTPPAANWNHDRENPNGSVGSQRVRLNAVQRVLATSAHLMH